MTRSSSALAAFCRTCRKPLSRRRRLSRVWSVDCEDIGFDSRIRCRGCSGVVFSAFSGELRDVRPVALVTWNGSVVDSSGPGQDRHIFQRAQALAIMAWTVLRRVSVLAEAGGEPDRQESKG